MSDEKLFPVSNVLAFVKRCMVAAGAAEEHASLLAGLLVAADSRGHYSHGLNRLGQCPISHALQTQPRGSLAPFLL